jgi:hypothetical protein
MATKEKTKMKEVVTESPKPDKELEATWQELPTFLANFLLRASRRDNRTWCKSPLVPQGNKLWPFGVAKPSLLDISSSLNQSGLMEGFLFQFVSKRGNRYEAWYNIQNIVRMFCSSENGSECYTVTLLGETGEMATHIINNGKHTGPIANSFNWTQEDLEYWKEAWKLVLGPGGEVPFLPSY